MRWPGDGQAPAGRLPGAYRCLPGDGRAPAGTGQRADCFAGWVEGPSVHDDEASRPRPGAGLDHGNTPAPRQNRCSAGRRADPGRGALQGRRVGRA
jgi:hypothetical protein